jgi:nicotinamide mononucleotide adenylyltransferase
MSEKESSLPVVVFTYGRMNPPHSGHMGLLNEMIELALNKGGKDVIILLSSSNDPKKNPLLCSQKKILALEKGMIQKAIDDFGERAREITVRVYCPEDLDSYNNASSMIKSAVNNIYPDQPVHLVMLVGEDRASQFDWIGKSVEPHIFEPRFSKRSEEGISATRIRSYVSSGNREAFMREMSNTGLSRDDLFDLYTSIDEGMSKKEIRKTPKPKTEVPKTRKRKTKKEEDDNEEEDTHLEKTLKIGGKSRRRRRKIQKTKRPVTKKHRYFKR